MRTHRGRQAYYCPGHARVARKRRQQLAGLVETLTAEIAHEEVGNSGRASTRRGRRLRSDLDFLTRILASYALAETYQPEG